MTEGKTVRAKSGLRRLGFDPFFPIPLIGTIIVWEALTDWTQVLSPLFLPSFVTVMRKLFELLAQGQLAPDIYASLYRIVAGFLLSTALGVAIGWMIGWYKTIGRLTYPLVYILYPLPKIAFLGIFMVWFGLGELTNIVQSTFGATFTVIITVIAGIRGVDPFLLRVAKDYRATDTQIMAKVALPAATPVILTAIKLGLGVAFIVTISSEMVINPSKYGLGVLIINSAYTLDSSGVFAAIIILSVLALVIFQSLELIEKRLVPWRQE